jgi:phage-related protein
MTVGTVPKPLVWMGSSRKDLKALPRDVVKLFGYALYVVQAGGRHEQTKVLRGFGDASVLEVIESTNRSTYRAVYTIRFIDAVYVLHVFQKKSKSGLATPKSDLDLIEQRLKQAAAVSRRRGRGAT